MSVSRPGSVGGRLPTGAAGVLAVVGVGLAAISLLVWASRGFPRLPQSLSRTPVAIVPSQLSAIACIVVGALLGHRVQRNAIGWLLLAVGYAMVLILPVALLIAQAHQAFRPAPDPVRQAAWVVSSLSTPIVLAGLALVALLFPDGRLGSRWRRVAAALTIAAALSFAAATAFDPIGLVWYPTIPNPFAAPSELQRVFALLRPASAVLMLASLVSVVIAVWRRYQTGDEVIRAQLRWMVFAVAILVLCVVPFVVARYVVPTSDALGEVIMAVANLSGAAIPVAAAFAITRYRLFGIDRLITRALVYVPLIGVLGGLYALAVALFQRLFVAITGTASDVPMLVAVFLIAAAFTPLRKAMEGAVERWARSERTTDGDARRNVAAVLQAAPSTVRDAVAAPVTPVTAPLGSARREPSAAEADEAEALRAVAAVAAIRRLEARLADAVPDGDATLDPQVLPIDGDGKVACPAGSLVPFSFCLRCPYLTSISVAPAEVRCRRPVNP